MLGLYVPYYAQVELSRCLFFFQSISGLLRVRLFLPLVCYRQVQDMARWRELEVIHWGKEHPWLRGIGASRHQVESLYVNRMCRELPLS